MSRTAPETCAICGGDIPPRAHACPHCGADERTGWAEQDAYDGIDLPESNEASPRPPRAAFSPMVLSILAVLVLAALLRYLL